MRWILLLLLAGLLEAQELEVSFDVKTDFSGRASNQCKNVLETAERARSLDDWVNKSFSPRSSLQDVLGFLRSFASLEGIPPNEAYLLHQSSHFQVHFDNLGPPKSRLSIKVATHQTTSIAPRLTLDGLFGYYLSTNWGQTWFDDLTTFFGPGLPPSKDPDVLAWATMLENAGYPGPLAINLAVLAKSAGIKLWGDTGAILLDALTNTVFGDGDFIGDLDLNKNSSRFDFRSFRLHETAVRYDLAITPWFSANIQARLLQASTRAWSRRLLASSQGNLWHVGQSFTDDWTTMPEDPRWSGTADIGVTFRPPIGLTTSVTATSITCPRFKWEDWDTRIDPRILLEARWDFIEPINPISLWFRTDLIRYRDPAAPWIRHGELEIGLLVEPVLRWGIGGGLVFRVDWGMKAAPEIEARLRFWHTAFFAEFTASSSWEVLQTQDLALPSSWRISATIGFRTRW